MSDPELLRSAERSVDLWSKLIRDGKPIGADWIAVKTEDTNALFWHLARIKEALSPKDGRDD